MPRMNRICRSWSAAFQQSLSVWRRCLSALRAASPPRKSFGILQVSTLEEITNIFGVIAYKRCQSLPKLIKPGLPAGALARRGIGGDYLYRLADRVCQAQTANMSPARRSAAGGT